MGHSIGDGIIVVALAATLLGYLYLKYLGRARRLEIIHQERLVAMDKGIPLPELPIDPPIIEKAPNPRILPLLGIALMAVGGGSMIALSLLPSLESRAFWPIPLPVAMMGLGLLLYHLLAANRER